VGPFEMAAILLAGIAAGTINTVVGSGTLVTFPTLLAFGVPPVTANISNGLGLLPGSISGAYGYRRELIGQRARVVRLASATVAGAVVGAILLLVLPSSAFDAIVPVLIGAALVLVVLQPRISRWMSRRHEHLGGLPETGAAFSWPLVFLIGVYCGYFGAAQGIMLMAVLGVAIPDTMQRVNGLKNVLSGLGLGVSSLIFLIAARDHIDWTIVALLAVGATIGGQVGASWGRKLPAPVLRCLIVAVGATALAHFLIS
jgi:uncharacterized membrane protein YfcA